MNLEQPVVGCRIEAGIEPAEQRGDWGDNATRNDEEAED